ncbi:MAG: hypothetical protein ACR2HJ_03675 [Fimbriimonadales bacterium]
MVRITGALICVLAAWPNPCAADGYEITWFGTLGAENSSCNYISDSGVVLGTTNTLMYGFAFPRAFVYRRGVITRLPSLPGDITSVANAINESGIAVGFCTDGFEGPPHAAMWDRDANVSPMQELPPGYGDLASANDINDVGQVILNLGGQAYQNGAALWQYHSYKEILPEVGHVGVGDTNEHGVIVGAVGITYDRAFVWRSGHVTMLPSGTHSSVAVAINNTGTIVGGIDDQAVIWSSNKIIEFPGSRFPYSYAIGVNDRNQVIGVTYNGVGRSEYFLWENGIVLLLDSLIPAGSRFVELRVSAINNAGQMCGQGSLPDGSTRGFVLTPK